MAEAPEEAHPARPRSEASDSEGPHSEAPKLRAPGSREPGLREPGFGDPGFEAHTPDAPAPGTVHPAALRPDAVHRSAADAAPRRAVVAHPRTLAALSRAAAGGAGGRTGAAPGDPGRLPYAATADDLGAPSRLGDLYLRSLMRTQLRLGLSVVGALVVLLAGIPLACATVPELREATVGGVPVPWLLVAVAPHPVFLVLGVLNTRQAEANERDFARLMDRPGGGPGTAPEGLG